jgi:signal transduction histidine kinase
VDVINIIYRDFSKSHQEIIDRYRQGKHKGIRWITSLKTKKDIGLVKSFIDNGIKIRHVPVLLTDSFALSDKSFLFTIEDVDEGKNITNVLSSNDKLYLDHYDRVFEKLWKKGIDVQDRIKEIEEGYIFNIDTIPRPKESLKFYKELLKTVKDEILIMLASSSAFFRVENNIGYSNLEELAHKNIKVKILFPLKTGLEYKANQIKSLYPKIEFRVLQNSLASFIGVTIIDKQQVLITEIKDDSKFEYPDAIGNTIHIKGKSTALSYVTIFNNLWKQAELYDEIKKAYDIIQVHDKMQKEFVDIAAHELRTPIHPMLGFIEILRNKITDKEQLEFLDIIDRNTKRLKKISEDILEVSKIENNLLILNKEDFEIKEMLLQMISDYKREAESKKINLLFMDKCIGNDLFICADKEKIRQVISNLISNSIKFIPEAEGGKIYVSFEKRTKNEENRSFYDAVENSFVIITIKDIGVGIDEDILPLLFTKFASRSFQGTGLGLYICKNIIDAHGGKIWACNNEGEEGATFSFSLPLIDSHANSHPKEKHR